MAKELEIRPLSVAHPRVCGALIDAMKERFSYWTGNVQGHVLSVANNDHVWLEGVAVGAKITHQLILETDTKRLRDLLVQHGTVALYVVNT